MDFATGPMHENAGGIVIETAHGHRVIGHKA